MTIVKAEDPALDSMTSGKAGGMSCEPLKAVF